MTILTDKNGRPFSEDCVELAKDAAEAINGGKWETDYTLTQQRGWCFKAEWFWEEITGSKIP